MLNQNGKDSLANHKLFITSRPGQALQKEPLGFIDVGARGGTHELVDPIAKLTRVLGFEADREECQRLLQNPEVVAPWADFQLEPIALADNNGTRELFLLSANTNHSLLPPNECMTKRYNMQKWQVLGKCALPTTTLDEVLSQKKLNKGLGEFIKLDTQGTEYEILQGAKDVLTQHTVAVVTEVAFCELYQGQKLFSDVEMLMRTLGFTFYGFTRLHTRSKKLLNKKHHVTRERILYSDAIFFKDPLSGTPALSERGNFVLFTTALLLGFYDFALELASASWASEADERQRIHDLVFDLSKLETQQTQKALTELVTAVNQQPELANIAVGGFIDERRHYCDYDDVLNISPLPKTL